MVAAQAPPLILLKFFLGGGGPEQKNKFNGELNLRGDLKFLVGVMNPSDVMVHSVHWGINPLQKHPSP